MNRALVDPIANAVLYEGYILYPYRPSIKNRQRWTFGGLYPEPYVAANAGSDAAENRTECLVHGSPETTIEAAVRFLHLTDRRVGEVDPPLADWPATGDPPSRAVETLRVGDRLFHSWQEAEEREVVLGAVTLGDLTARPQSLAFTFPGGRRSEPVRGTAGEVVGLLVREQQAISGALEASAVRAAEGLYRVTLRVANRTPMADAASKSRDDALMRTLVSTHAVLGVRRGEFVSLLDPPDRWRDAAVACRNVGTWPVMVGEEGRNEMMLSSPIILYDYPQIAPESQGDFFDGTEIDEMLTLRVLTMTDEEKSAMAAVDGRAGALLARVEGLAREQLHGLHGTVRSLRPTSGGGSHG